MKELIRTKPLEKIRIREICEAAGIDRSTFYYHFRDKYDLIAWMYFRFIRELNVLNREESSKALEILKEDAFIFRNGLAANAQNSLSDYIKRYYIEYYTELLCERAGKESLDEEMTFQVHLFCFGAVEMMIRWILDNEGISAGRYTDLVYRSMPADMHRLCFPDGD